MTFFLMGTGLGDERSLTLAELDILKKAHMIYFERYTSVNSPPLAAYEALIGKRILPADRALVEERAEQELILPAKEKDIALLVSGDPLSATTHITLLQLARTNGVKVRVLHNASVLTALAETGLSLYKFGRTVTLPFSHGEEVPTSPYEMLAENAAAGLHTLVLLDLDPENQRFMTIREAILILRICENRVRGGSFPEGRRVIVAAALGTEKQRIILGTPAVLEAKDIPEFPRCLIIPGKLSHYEEEALALLENI